MRKTRVLSCTVCGDSYETYNLRSVACSRRCFSEWKRRTYKGRKFTKEHNDKLSIAKRRENVRKEGDYRCDQCDKLFTSNTSLRSHRSYCSSTNEPTSVTCSVCNKVFKRQRGLTWHMRSHDPEFFEIHSNRVSKGLETARPMKRNSEAEIKFVKKLIDVHGENVVHKFRIEGVNHEYDFYVAAENLIVEFDGDYWHGNKENFELTPKMKRQYWLDKVYTLAAQNAGYAVRRVWESKADQYPNDLRKMGGTGA